jgi:hypothetical protein
MLSFVPVTPPSARPGYVPAGTAASYCVGNTKRQVSWGGADAVRGMIADQPDGDGGEAVSVPWLNDVLWSAGFAAATHAAGCPYFYSCIWKMFR